MLEVKKLTVCYNDFLALNEISLKIQEGALTGIIGPNGAGKSTLLKAMLNIIPHQGDVSNKSKRMCIYGNICRNESFSKN